MDALYQTPTALTPMSAQPRALTIQPPDWLMVVTMSGGLSASKFT